jgi:catechol 2,3-dioxygenase-like lactoylglutathione lyase family enzyme
MGDQVPTLTEFPVHATVAASDLDRARRWYEEKLGLIPDQEESGGLWFHFAGDTWLHVYQTGFAGTAQNTVAGITVKGIEAVMDRLKAQGVVFEEYDMPGLTTVDGLVTWEIGKAAWFKDSEGNTFELSETM